MKTVILAIALFSQVPANQQGTPIHQANLARSCMNGAKQNCGTMRAMMASYRDQLAPLARTAAINASGKPNQIAFGDADYTNGGTDEPAADALFVQAQQLELQADTAWSGGNYSTAANLYRQTDAAYEKAKKAYGVAEREYRGAEAWFMRSIK